MIGSDALSVNHTKRTLAERLEGWFPDREFFMRSQGQVRFIKVSSRLQKGVTIAVIILALGWAGSLTVMAWNKYIAEAQIASFQAEKAEVAKAEQRLEAYSGDLEKTVADLQTRQQALEAMSEMLPDDIKTVDTNVTDSSKETAKTVEQVGTYFPQAKGLAEVEARQIAFVENMTRFADWRALKAEEALRKLNLDPRALARTGRFEAMGGPLEVLASAADGFLDPRFERLGLSLARMNRLEEVLDGVPRVIPTADGRVTSPFGFRRDPFTGRAAMHSGIDYGGPIGAPIFAAAAGKVVFVGWKGGYGRVIDVEHGNGMLTRYAHLHRYTVTLGDSVAAGQTIAGLGSSGRSTGPHLHFEVRINGRAVNPRPFLETAPDVFKEARRTEPRRPDSARSQL
ncbi:MAG: peptidoglycan DD-metalloendopeptidase family protein [Pseudomonadota bacterium]